LIYTERAKAPVGLLTGPSETVVMEVVVVVVMVMIMIVKEIVLIVLIVADVVCMWGTSRSSFWA
jgi:hypothetical protein